MLNDKDLALAVLGPLFGTLFITSMLYCLFHEFICVKFKKNSKNVTNNNSKEKEALNSNEKCHIIRV
ncbi:unnamed protein product [Brachionus calyciflorus]|uniref:Uncharacterized protein n=1 Tax=Brachionus calyciflorus TaxID=104777 RepID=A0A814BG86_9BILA|nr:unnamed protein product [Brachionus calyciflorus]